MNGTSRIVVGVDHSEESLGALEFAVHEAALRGNTLEVVWAWGDHLPAADEYGDEIDATAMEALAQAQLEGLVADRIPDGVDAVVRAVIDKPGSALIDAARSARLLVVGARGAGGFLGLRLGSVSSKVTDHAPCPVVVVHPPVTESGTDESPRIVVGIDGSDSARSAFDWALAEATLRAVPVVAVNGWMDPGIVASSPGLMPPIEMMQRAAERLLETEFEYAAHHAPGVTVVTQATCGGAASALIEESRGASLVVVGSRGQGRFMGRLLGSVAQQVLRHAECPAVVVPSSEDATT